VHKVDTPTLTTMSPNDPPRTQPKLETSSKQRGRHPRLDRRIRWPRWSLGESIVRAKGEKRKALTELVRAFSALSLIEG